MKCNNNVKHRSQLRHQLFASKAQHYMSSYYFRAESFTPVFIMFFAITRHWLYLVVFLTSFLVIFPLSCLTYVNFYNVLIHKPVISIPVGLSDKTIVLDLTNYADHLNQEPSIEYDVVIYIKGYCPRNSLEYFVGRMDIFHDGVHVGESSTQFTCGSRDIHNQHNYLIPYNLKYWVPPILVNNDRSVEVYERLTSITAGDLKHSKQMQIKTDLRIVAIPKSTRVDLIVRWEGIRYYIFRYYYTSFVVGVLFFWFCGCFVCAITAFTVWSIVQRKQKKD